MRRLLVPRGSRPVGERVDARAGGIVVSSGYYGSSGRAVLYLPDWVTGELRVGKQAFNAPVGDALLYGNEAHELMALEVEWLRVREMSGPERAAHEHALALIAADPGGPSYVELIGNDKLRAERAGRLGVTVPAVLTITVGYATTDPVGSVKWALHPEPPDIETPDQKYVEGYGNRPRRSGHNQRRDSRHAQRVR